MPTDPEPIEFESDRPEPNQPSPATRLVSPSEDAVAEAIEAFRQGQVIALPTDTVYGLAAMVASPEGLEKLFDIKGRDRSQAIAVLVGSKAQADELVAPSSGFDALANAFWPGPMTIITKRSSVFHADLGGDATSVGVRFAQSEIVSTICAEVGPIAASSANVSGQETLRTPDDIRRDFRDQVAVVIDGGVKPTLASTVVDLRGPVASVIRSGAISPEQVAAALAHLA